MRKAINNNYLKQVRLNGYSNTRHVDFLDIAINNFLDEMESLNETFVDENGNEVSLFDENNDLISDEAFKKLSLFDKNGVPFNYKIMKNLKMKLKRLF